MSIAGTASRWYHKKWVMALIWIFAGLFLGAVIMGITIKQLYGAAKGKVLPNAAAILFLSLGANALLC